MSIIGITGKAGHGKSTVAAIITKYRPSIKQVAFAGKVKEVFTVLTGVPYKDTQEFKNMYMDGWGMTVREMLQKIGTDAMRNGLDQDVWVKALFKTMVFGRRYVVTDVRFKNECFYIEKNGGLVIRVVRPGYDNGTPDHVSETELDGTEFLTVVNDGTIEDLERQVIRLIQTRIDNL